MTTKDIIEDILAGKSAKAGVCIVYCSNNTVSVSLNGSLIYASNPAMPKVRKTACKVRDLFVEHGHKCSNVSHSIYGIHTFEINGKDDISQDEEEMNLEMEDAGLI